MARYKPNIKKLSIKHRNGREDDLPKGLSSRQREQVLDEMRRPEVEKRVEDLLKSDEGGPRVRASGMC